MDNFIVDLDFLINSKNKSSRNWNNHNFLFHKLSEILSLKLNELNSNFENILLLSADCDEALRTLKKKDFKNLVFISPYEKLLKRTKNNQDNILKVQSNFENLPCSNGKFNLIVSNLCLHTINEKKNHLIKIYDLLSEDGLFLCNFFGEGTLHELKNSLFKADEKIFNGIFMRFAPSLKMVEVSDLLSQIGFKELVSEKISYKIFHNHVIKILEDLKGMGEKNVLKNRKKGLITKNYIEILNKFYKENYISKNGLEISCDVISICGWKNKKV